MSPPRLPPFRALLAFRAAATHARLAEAAESLGVTESAISHQLRQLEGFLGAALFDRGPGRLALNEAGARYLERIGPALDEIEAAAETVAPQAGAGVRLTLPPSLAATWLIPRLHRFDAPGVEILLTPTTRLVNLARDRIDLALRYGRGPWPGVAATALFEDRATPVAAPGYARPGPGGELPRDLRYLATAGIPGEWEEWARARGLTPPAPDAIIPFDSIEQALSLAEEGHGIAMGRSPYIEARLVAGRLVTPFGGAETTGAAYHLCRPEGPAPAAPVRKVMAWIEAEAALFRADQGG